MDLYDMIYGDERDGTNVELSINREKKEKKVKDVNVVPRFKVEDVYCEPPHENLLRLPFSLLEIAPKGSGKTCLLHNIMMWYHSYFDQIIIISPTINLDVKWKLIIEELEIPEENLFERYIDSEIKSIMDEIKEFNEGKVNKEKIRVLMIFDDVIDMLPRNQKGCALNTLAFNHRHYNISHIIISQSFKKLDCNIRSNTTGLILFNTYNNAERAKIVEEICGNLGKKKFYEYYRNCVKEKYNFMYVNYDNAKLYHNFTKELCSLNETDGTFEDLNI